MGKIKAAKKELWVGVLGIIAILLVYLLVNFFKGVNIFDEGEKYYIEFDDLGEVVKTSPVYIRGYKVGNVSGITYDYEKASGVCVEISVDDKLRIPQGSGAKINSKILGSSTVELLLGESNEMLSPGDTIKGVFDAGALHEAGKMIPQVSDLLPKADSILTSLNRILQNPAIENSIGNIEMLTRELNRTATLLNSTLEGDVKEAAGKLIEIEDDLLAVSAQLSEVDYLALVNSIENSLKNIEQATAALNNGEGTAGMLLNDTTLYNRLLTVCEAAEALLQDLKENPKRYVHFSVFGKKDKK